VARPPVGCAHLAPPPKESEDSAPAVYPAERERERERDTATAIVPAGSVGGRGDDKGGDEGGNGGGGDSGGVGMMEWRAEVHAVGSSRPWALGVNRWGKDKAGKGGRSGRGKRRRRHTLGNTGGGGRRGEGGASSGSESELDDPEFPFWALPEIDLPVTFTLKKAKL